MMGILELRGGVAFVVVGRLALQEKVSGFFFFI